MKCGLASVLVAVMLGMMALPARADDQQDIRKMMETAIEKTISILANPELKGDAKREERRTQIRNTLLALTDARRVSMLVLGRQRSNFSEAQLKEFTDTFAQLVFVTYIQNLEKYTDQKVQVVSVELQQDGKAYATTKVLSKDKEFPADFSLFKDEHGEWKCYDVKVEGVSMISNYRSQFNELLINKTPDQIIAHLKEKVKENEQAR